MCGSSSTWSSPSLSSSFTPTWTLLGGRWNTLPMFSQKLLFSKAEDQPENSQKDLQLWRPKYVLCQSSSLHNGTLPTMPTEKVSATKRSHYIWGKMQFWHIDITIYGWGGSVLMAVFLHDRWPPFSWPFKLVVFEKYLQIHLLLIYNLRK